MSMTKYSMFERNQTNIQKGKGNLRLLQTTRTPNFQAKSNKCRTFNSGKQGPYSLRPMSSSKGITTSYKGSWFLDISKEGFLRFNLASKIRVHSKSFPIQSSSYTFGDLITGQGSNYSNADNNNTNLKIEYMKNAVYSL